MIEPLDQRTPPMTPQLALRVAIVGTIALVLFALIFFRLWFLQVLSGSEYVAEAQGNIIQTVPVAASRGDILASDGSTLVSSTPVPAVEIEPPDLPTPLTYQNFQQDISKDGPLFNRLAAVLRMSTKPEPCRYTVYLPKSKRVPYGYLIYDPKLAQIPCLVTQSIANQAYANVTIKTDVTADVQAYLAERQRDFPGVSAQQPVYLRSYQYGALGAQMFGTVGPITSLERQTEAEGGGFKGAHATDIVGQSGLEYEYDQYLLGIDGTERVKVNADDQFEGYANETQPTPGYNLRTWINLGLQQVGEKALKESIAKNSTAGADGGAFVAMDPQNGEIYAMGSYPTYQPSIFTHPISTKTYDADFYDNPGHPLLNRAISSPLPDGSTFKVITATAALESGVWTAGEPWDDNGSYCYPGANPALPGSCLHNASDASFGPVDLERAIQVSDDVYFYHLGYILNGSPTGNGGALQTWARRFGIGQPTGVDLPGEASGTLPTPNVLKALYAQELECEAATGIYSYSNGQGLVSATDKPGYHRSPKHPASQGGCGISNASVENWTAGDNVNTAVGQGDVQVTPLQLAVVYAALANDGSIVTPHIADDIESSTGDVLQRIDPAPKRHLDINPAYRAAILAGLHAAAQEQGGTSDDVMGKFPLPVYGKTGTAQEGTAEQIATNTESDYAWYACFVPASATTKPIVIVVSVEKGGFGDVAAAPVARQMLSQWFYGKPGQYLIGSSPDT
jgi:penicillin-binding protein 2